MSVKRTDPHSVDGWREFILDREVGYGNSGKRLPILYYLVSLVAVLFSVMVFLFVAEATIRTISEGAFLSLDELSRTPQEAMEQQIDAYTMETKETFDRDAYPLLVPETITASSEFGDDAKERRYQPAHLFDGTVKKTWQEDRSEDTVGEEWIRLTFDEEQSVQAIGIWPGNEASREKFYANSRPQTLKITFTDDDGREYTKEITLTDESIEQIMVFDEPVSVTALNIQITSVYEGAEHGNVMISEMAIYGKGEE